MPVGVAWKPDGVTATVASQFVDGLTQTCAGGNQVDLERLSFKGSVASL